MRRVAVTAVGLVVLFAAFGAGYKIAQPTAQATGTVSGVIQELGLPGLPPVGAPNGSTVAFHDSAGSSIVINLPSSGRFSLGLPSGPYAVSITGPLPHHGYVTCSVTHQVFVSGDRLQTLYLTWPYCGNGEEAQTMK